jgi:hypothetical protein
MRFLHPQSKFGGATRKFVTFSTALGQMTDLTINNNIIRREEAPFVSFDTGSFLQHDPIPAANPYSYTDNDPVNFTDPLGLKKKCQIEERSRIGKYEVCDSLYCPRGQCHAQSKCLSKFSKQCDSLRSKGYDRTASGWDPYYGDAWCSGCTIFSRVKSCDELCAKYPGFPDCKEKCEAKRDPKAQDNQSDGKNDGEGGGGMPQDCDKPSWLSEYTDKIKEYLDGLNMMEERRQDMKEKNRIGADKFYHCLANCEVARKYGKDVSEFWGNVRELTDKYRPDHLIENRIKRGRAIIPEDHASDQKANEYGRNAPLLEYSCWDWCLEKYPAGPTKDE